MNTIRYEFKRVYPTFQDQSEFRFPRTITGGLLGRDYAERKYPKYLAQDQSCRRLGGWP